MAGESSVHTAFLVGAGYIPPLCALPSSEVFENTIHKNQRHQRSFLASMLSPNIRNLKNAKISKY